MPSWPIDLPQSLPVGFRRDRLDARVRTEMDAGPAQIRRRFTAVPEFIRDINFTMSRFQADRLRYFFDADLGGGVSTFTWFDPWPGAGTVTFRFMDQPTETPITGGLHHLTRVSFSLEVPVS